MPRKSRAQIEREIADELARRHHVQFQVPGGRLLWMTSKGTGSFSSDDAHDFGSREAAERRIEAMRGSGAGTSLRYATTRKAPA